MKAVKKTITISFLFISSYAIGQNAPNLDDVMKDRVTIANDSTSVMEPNRSKMFNPQKIADLPLFCKMEELIFNKSKMNLRLNLGSNAYVRKLEGK